MTDRLEVRIVAPNTAGGLSAVRALDLDGARRRLAPRGGYEVVHASPSLEVGVYVLVAPEPDHDQPDGDDELYIVLDGSGVLDVAGEAVDLSEGHAVFIPAGTEHRFTAYEQLRVLVIVERRA